MRRFLVILAFTFLTCGCATTGSDIKKLESESAKEEFEDAIKSLKGGYYQEAIDKFNQIKIKYPFSIYATEAELKIADSYFEDEKYIEAAEAYTEFIKLHPSHPMVDYAAYRVALSYYNDAPSDWLILPPSYEKDQSSNIKARKAFLEFLLRYKGSKFEGEARKYLEKVDKRLINHDVYVAKFYFNRKKYEAVENRIKNIVRQYGIVDGMDEALYLLCSSLFFQNKMEEFDEMFSEMSRKFPKSKYLERLQNLQKSKRRG
ncbi:MAG: outer membrane protein assembly factor BamD [Deltaproteobacteria bacterium]|nr:outer membrane protein assembly factor BamD [Deltaproteobacteria bacterium]